MIIQFSAQIDSVHAKKEKTLSIRLGSQELAPNETSTIFEQMGKQVWVAIAESSVNKEDLKIPDVVDELDDKTPSKRLRDRMAVYYKETHGSFEGFNVWYQSSLEKLGQSYLDKLN